MKLEEAVQLFDRQLPLDSAWLVLHGTRIGVPYCCDCPVVENSREGFTRLYCQVCGREIREVGRQWVVSDWGRKGISFLRLNAALTVEASREMARSSVPDYDSAEMRMLRAAGEYLRQKGWVALVMNADRIQHNPSDRANDYELVLRFTGGGPKASVQEREL